MDLHEDLLDEYVTGSLEYLAMVDPVLDSWARRGATTREECNVAFRALHNIKSTSGFVGQEHVQQLSHVSETLLMHLRDGTRDYTEDVTQTLRDVVSTLRSMLDAVPTSGEPQAHEPYPRAVHDSVVALIDGTSGGSEESSATRQEDLRARFGEVAVDLGFITRSQVDHLLTLQAESEERKSLGALGRELGFLDDAAIKTITAEQTLRLLLAGKTLSLDPLGLDSERGFDPVDSAVDAVDAPDWQPRRLDREPTVRVTRRFLERVDETSAEIERLQAEVEDRSDAGTLREIGFLLDRTRALTREVRREIVDASSGHFEELLGRVRAQVSELSDRLDRPVELTTFGDAVEIEHSILWQLTSPIEHLVTNAVDHGLEPATERRAAGKASTGKVELRAYREPRDLLVEVCDDGRGIDVDRVRLKALERGLRTSAELREFDEHQLLQLILEPGFSTRESVSLTSGRGIGLNSVLIQVERAGGSVEIESEAGQGTCVRLRIPLDREH